MRHAIVYVLPHPNGGMWVKHVGYHSHGLRPITKYALDIRSGFRDRIGNRSLVYRRVGGRMKSACRLSVIESSLGIIKLC